MKRKNLFATLALIMVLFSVDLRASNPPGVFNISEGDWFEIQIKLPLDFSIKKGQNQPFYFLDSNHAMFKPTPNLHFTLRFCLTRQAANGNQVYQVSIERIKTKTCLRSSGIWLGYDSFYPVYNENVDKKRPKGK
jgi:hypothetical protein